MNAEALAQLKAAAARKKSGFKAPVVKEIKITREQYLQEKAEQEAKKNKKKALLGIPDDPDDVAPVAAAAAAGPDPRVTELLMQIQKERKALQMEKEAMAREMQEMRSVMTNKMNQMQEELEELKAEGPPSSSDKKSGKKGWFGRKGGESNNDSFKETEVSAAESSSDPKLKAEMEAMKEIDSLKDQIIESLNQSLANLQADNKRYKQQQQQPQQAPLSRASDDAVTSAALADLEERIETLERGSARIERQVNNSAEEFATKDALTELLNRLKALENGAVRTRARDRSRSLGENQLRVDNNGVPRGGTRMASAGTTPASRAAAARNAAASPVSADDEIPSPQASPRASPRPIIRTPSSASPVSRTPRRTTSDASSSSSSSSGSSSSDSEAKKPKGPPVATATTAAMERFVRPHSIATMAKAQARDERLMKFLEKPGGAGAMYPKFCMSVKSVEGVKLIFFHKRCYIPESLRQKTLKYYYENYNDDGHWSQAMSRSAIWPTLDADVTTFKP